MPIDPELKSLKGTDAALRLYTSRIRLSRSGAAELEARCPFHSERTPSFKLKRKPEGWVWSCHGACQTGGDVVDFIERIAGVSKREAIDIVKEAVGANKTVTQFRPKEWHRKKELVETTFHSAAFEDKAYKTMPLAQYTAYEDNLVTSQEAQDWLLRERGITYETAKKLHLGFRQDVGQGAGRGNEDIADKGWITFPCIEEDLVVSLKFRSIARKAFTRKSGMATALFNSEMIEPIDPVFVTEGEYDTAALVQAGFRAVSLPSAIKNIPIEMKDQLMNADEVFLAGDCDGKVGTEVMTKLWHDINERSYLLTWPAPYKDANEVFVKMCGRDVARFRKVVEDLSRAARSSPMPGVYSMPDVMQNSEAASLADHKDRLRFPWKSVDDMAILLPGSVYVLSATNTGMGKTLFVFQETLYSARVNGEVVINYQVELSTTESANILAAQVLQKDRNFLTPEDVKEAGRMLAVAGVKYYVGNRPSVESADEVLDLIEAAIERLGGTHVVLDHLHFICRADDEIQVQARAMQRIKKMAQETGVKFGVVGQPRKAEQKNKGKAIHITDFKGSEAITSDADAVYALDRAVLKNIDANKPPRDIYDPVTTIVRLKARAAGVGNAFTKLVLDGCTATFREITYDPEPPNLPDKKYQTQIAV